ncbi:helix-turn-helix transcriptional regulator [Clostridium sp. C2-6-12]|uniref:helix-turn-helix domain-containing protein n=1 Tax=Clostridium sp. C2-6-12 TaxID=2698832 RepID=UPI0013699CD9|nr:helix-turn-helix transcriptional regulator [Clostridium sp. C2-6-12]
MLSTLELERRKQGLTQKQLYAKSGVSTSTICNIERNGIKTIPVRTLEKLAEALNTTVTELFFSDEQ